MKYLGIEYTYHKCGGLGDRLCGLINVIMLSKIFNKTFFIKWDETNNLNKFLDYSNFNFYNLKDINDKKTKRINFIDGKDKKLIEVLKEINDKEDFDKFFDFETLILNSNQDSNRFVINNSNIDFSFEDYKNMIMNEFKNIYTKYLIPNEDILNKVNELILNYKNRNIVGIQVRCGDSYMVKGNKHTIISNMKDIYNIFRNIKRDLNEDDIVFITSDHYKVYEIGNEVFNEVFFYDKKPVHCDMNYSKKSGKGDKEVDGENVDKILVDHLILSNYCNKLYISGSNFGRTASLINETEDIYHLFNKKKLNKLLLISKLNEYNNEFKKYM